MPSIDENNKIFEKNRLKIEPNANPNQITIVPTPFGRVKYSNPNPANVSQAVFTETIAEHSLDSQNGSIASSNRFEITETDEFLQMSHKIGLKKDEYAIFGEFIANELRSMKTDQFRRKLKRAFQKCLLDLAEEEEAAIQAKQVHLM